MSDLVNFLGWYLVILAVGWISFPIIFRFLPHLTSKGFGLARPLGLLIWGYVFWLLCSLGILQNNTGGVLLAILILLGGSIWSCLQGRFKELIDWVKSNKTTLITMEILFFLAFAGWSIVRSANPEVAYTEKPMELAFINSILKSPTFPPQDPWLSGYAISYYYFGYVLISMLIRVTGVASSTAFNLSAALWFGLTALAIYGIVFDLLAARKLSPDQKTQSHIKIARTGAFLGPLFVLIVSCLEGVLEFLYSWGVFWKTDALGNIISKFWSWLSINELETAPTTAFSFFPNRPSSWMWWRGSRVIQDLSLSGNKIEIIDEFPFFSYLLSDLHPHVLAMPFGLLAIGICLNLLLTPRSDYTIGESVFKWFKRWDFWLISLLLGSLAFINTWDFPIYVGLFCVSIIFVRVKEHGWSWTRAWEFIQYGLAVGVTGILLFLPFYLGFSSQAGGLLPSMEYMTRGVHFWILFGALLIPIMIWLIVQIRHMKTPRKLFSGLKLAITIFILLFLASLVFGILILNADQVAANWMVSANSNVAALGQKLYTAVQYFEVTLHGSSDTGFLVWQTILRRLISPGTWLTLLFMITVVWALLFGKTTENENQQQGADVNNAIQVVQGTRERDFICLLILLGAALTAFPEFFYLRDQFGTRMNTIFKFYFQAWILWGIVAAYVSVELICTLKGLKQKLFSLVCILSIAGGLAYPTIMLWEKTNGLNPTKWTLDGNAYLETYYQDDYAAIQWLAQQPLGVVSEAIGGSYSEYARVSTRTGFPTVLGWPGHEGQWRGGYSEVGSRESDIKELYTTVDWNTAWLIIERYDIRYIFVGSLEKTLYNANADTFTSNLPTVYQNSSVIIFEVPDEEGETAP